MEVALSKGGLQDEFFLEYVCDRDLNTNTHTHTHTFANLFTDFFGFVLSMM